MSHFRVLKRGAEIVRSLAFEGYRVMNRDPVFDTYYLRHANGNTMQVVIVNNQIRVYKNGKIKKVENVTLR